MISIQVQVFLEVSSVHEVGKFLWYWEVTVAGHLFTGVDITGAVQTRVPVLGRFPVMPQAPDGIVLLKTCRFDTHLYAMFDGSEAGHTRTNDTTLFGHLELMKILMVLRIAPWNTELHTAISSGKKGNKKDKNMDANVPEIFYRNFFLFDSRWNMDMKTQ